MTATIPTFQIGDRVRVVQMPETRKLGVDNAEGIVVYTRNAVRKGDLEISQQSCIVDFADSGKRLSFPPSILEKR